MSWRCSNCGQSLTGSEKYCPNCATKTVYNCKNCGKQLDNGKHKYCALCRTEKAEQRKNTVKKLVGVVAAAGSFAAAMIFKKPGNKA